MRNGSVFVLYFGLAVVAGLIAGFDLGGSPTNALILLALISSRPSSGVGSFGTCGRGGCSSPGL